MALCALCSDIDLNDADNEYRYELLEPTQMICSAKRGCEGCIFFLNLAKLHFRSQGNASNYGEAGLKVQLRRLGEKSYHVDLEFIESKIGAPTSQGSVGLRLCSAYGEVSRFIFTIGLIAKTYRSGASIMRRVRGKIEVFPGRLISKNSKDSECLDLAAGWVGKMFTTA
jgi:hypothetical protein